jgi:hypothetical protein
MTSKAHQPAHPSVDADRVARAKDAKSGQRHVAAIADSSGDVITVTLAVDGVIETWKHSSERLDGYAQAA